MKRIFLLTALLGFASPAFAQYYGDSGASAIAEENAQAEAYNQQVRQQEYERQQEINQQQMQEQINRQQQQINSYNNASPIERMTGNY